MTPRLAALLLAATAMAGCAEMRRTPQAEPPAELSGGALAEPMPAIVALAARDFDRDGAGLEGRPAATALAAARLEWLAAEGGAGRRLESIPQSFLFGLQRGVDEMRASLAIHPQAEPAQAVSALVAAHRDLSRGVEPRLVAPVFREGTPTPRQRLAEPGPQPNASLATAALRDEYARQIEERRAGSRVLFDSPGMGVTTFGLGGTTDR